MPLPQVVGASVATAFIVEGFSAVRTPPATPPTDALNSRVRDDHTILGNHDDPIADIEALTGHFLVFVLW